ncbi:MAG TPA: ComEC/Rec2 family competence protein [Stellaceae bacterium]|nr:ComEC/Rec2 family competence protein [Stellaceae bacterium]
MAETAAAGGRIDAAPQPGTRLKHFLSGALAAEGERRQLWLPVCFGAGIAAYFGLTFEPALWPGAAAALGGLIFAFALRRHPGPRAVALALALFAAGFALMRATTIESAAPLLARRIGPVALTGRVTDIDRLDRGWRAVVAPDPLPGLAPAAQPKRVRIHIPPKSDPLDPGDRVGLRAMLFPVPGPALPGGYDFQRDAFFLRIGAVGYSYGPAHRLAEGSAAAGGWRAALRRLRIRMTRRIAAVLPGSTGGVASALITGKRGAIREEVKQAFRNSGLSHLLAIAGLHMGLVAAFVFFVVRGALALAPPVALRWPIKKIAAGVTLLVLFGYLLVSGAAIPTQRAFVMNGLVFGAILVDRLRISMRICALAATAVLLIDPEGIVGPSFQMSFGAVVGLIAVYETYGERLGRLWRSASLPGRVLAYASGIVVTTLVATAGTDPFAIYHFHRLALYSPLANVLAVPLSALWTLPWGLIACLLMPFGRESLALVPMGWGIDLTIRIAEFVSGLPGDVWPMPRLPLGGLLAIVFGGLWLAIWRGRWRRWGGAAIAAGLATMLLTRPPDIVMTDGGRFLAARAADGNYLVRAMWGEKFAGAILAEETGAALLPWPKDKAAGLLDCNGEFCSYRARGRDVAIVTGRAGLPVDCATFDAVVATVPAGFACRARIPVIDRIDSWRQGAVALWLGHDGVTVESANRSRGDRPWVPQPKKKHGTHWIR